MVFVCIGLCAADASSAIQAAVMQWRNRCLHVRKLRCVLVCRDLQVFINAVALGVSLAIALVTPGGAEKVYSIVGATGAVCLGRGGKGVFDLHML